MLSAALYLAGALTLLAASAAGAHASRADSSVGFEQLRIPNGEEPPLVGAVWYPSKGISRVEAIGPYIQSVVPAGPIAGHDLPLVVISHGGGGSYASHFDTALALARAGFVVASISHAGDTYDDQSKVLMLWRRPAQLSALLDYMLDAWPRHARIDPKRIGAYGFSNGGFTVLVEAGGVPELGKIDSYCAANPMHDICIALKNAGIRSVSVIQPPPGAWKADPRIRAIAMAAPAFGFAFDRSGLSQVQVPVQLWRGAVDKHQPNPWYEENIRSGLAREPDYMIVANAGHYSFLPPCPSSLLVNAPETCADAPGFDRAAFHRQLNSALLRFFRSSLTP